MIEKWSIIKPRVKRQMALLNRLEEKYKRSKEDLKKIKDNDDIITTIGQIYMSLNRFHYSPYESIHEAFMLWGTSDFRIERQDELFNDQNGNSISSLGGFYNSFWIDFPIGVPNDMPPLYYFACKKDFDGTRIGVVDRGNTRAIGCWRHGLYLVPAILKVHHFGDESLISKKLLRSPKEWKNLSFNGTPSNNEEFFLKHAGEWGRLTHPAKLIRKDKWRTQKYGLFPFDNSITRDVETGLFPGSEDKHLVNKAYENKVISYCKKANIPMFDSQLDINTL